jgi:LysM repeat protein
MRRVNRFLSLALIALLALTVAVGCTRPKPGLPPAAPPEEEVPATEEAAATPAMAVSPAAATEVPAAAPTEAPAAVPEVPAEETVVAAEPTAALTPPLATVVPTGLPTVVPAEITPFPTPGLPAAAEEPVPVPPTPVASPPPTTLESGQGFVYVVQPGDTLYSIAAQFGVSVDAIREANGLVSDDIVPGQELIIPGVPGPGPAPAPAPGVVPPPEGGTVHTVQPGETVYRISRMYGTTVEAIAAANGINPWFIWVGQRLIIPGPGGPIPPGPNPVPPSPGPNPVPPSPGPNPVPPPPDGGRTHEVQPGETLFSIALLYGVPVQDIVMANNLPNPNFIYPGQILIIP